MSHHELLDAVHAGISVILCEHSNSERGFLVEMKQKLVELTKEENIEFVISEKDRDPVLIV